MPHTDPAARAEYMKRYREANKDRLREKRLHWEDANQVHRAEYDKAYREANRESRREYARQWALSNEGKVRGYRRHTNHTPAARAARARYAANNPAKMAAQWAAREARKLQATPVWSDRGACDALYDLARLATELTGIKHSVDHIVPLRGKTVCGLHVQWNLRVVSQGENSTKGNRYWPNMP